MYVCMYVCIYPWFVKQTLDPRVSKIVPSCDYRSSALLLQKKKILLVLWWSGDDEIME